MPPRRTLGSGASGSPARCGKGVHHDVISKGDCGAELDHFFSWIRAVASVEAEAEEHNALHQRRRHSIHILPVTDEGLKVSGIIRSLGGELQCDQGLVMRIPI